MEGLEVYTPDKDAGPNPRMQVNRKPSFSYDKFRKQYHGQIREVFDLFESDLNRPLSSIHSDAVNGYRRVYFHLDV